MASETSKAAPAPAAGSLSSGARDLFAGMMAGFAVKLIEYPLDTIKVLQQTMGERYTGAWDCLRTTYHGGGIVALYRGLLCPLLGSMAECATLFVSYGAMKKTLGVDEDNATLTNPVPMWKYYIAGAGSGCCSAFVLTPVELVKCRLQVQSGAAAAGVAASARVYSGPLDCVMHILRHEGPTGLWRGNFSCLAREIPGNLAWFGAYELVLRSIQVARGYERKKDVPVGWSALAGSAAGVAYWGVPFPADTVKSLQQTDARFANRGFADVFGTVLREDGVHGLYRGAGITCARAAPGHALLFFAYELADRFL
eukprot:CAMPEP_0170303112 /NCGR_PEP_ID=MMETSP0116_2-20130129/51865_1 /TAXON_ID=400756 /ORGANISM="Durinskia baltica, Strain CSIRO CS-38" /LENGTH=310 /DNA_ID=CAMNT_0010555033 /DNA_START=55 /DNA_END=984 /DNA_ORIENTATION=+